MSATGLGAMLGIQWRTHRRGTLVWMFALIAMMVGSAGAVAGIYTTPEKIQTYAQAVTVGDALVAINGRVEGIDVPPGSSRTSSASSRPSRGGRKHRFDHAASP